MATRGIDVRQETDRIVFRVSLKDSGGAKVTTGTTEIRVYEVTDTGTLKVLDWTANTFVATGSGTPDDEGTMTHQNRRDSGGTDVATGVWTVVLSTLTNFIEGNVYIVQVTNTNAVPESQEREFQFGSVEGAESYSRAVKCIAYGVVNGTPTPTNTTFTASVITPAITVTDQYKGLILKFTKDTTTTALRGQGTDITANTAPGGGVGAFTFTAMTTLAQAGDTFTIS
jgi:hypothetical protein